MNRQLIISISRFFDLVIRRFMPVMLWNFFIS
jgi:hypothetical protein